MSAMKVCGILIAAAMMTSTAMAQSAAPEIVKVREAYAAATNAGDVKSIVRLYTEDAVELPPNQAMVKGLAALEKHYAGLLKGNTVKLSLTGIETTSAGDIGYYELTKHYTRAEARWIEAICAENPIGPLDQGLEPMPQADAPDF
jgi:ketosteroid isomerase-like protein